jgi:POLQ-like helicase
MHLLSEERRGFVLEQCLAKLILTTSSAQIIGLSATLGSIEKLQKFLKAEIFSTNFRPVELIENIKIGDTIYRYDNKEDSYTATKNVKRLVSFWIG